MAQSQRNSWSELLTFNFWLSTGQLARPIDAFSSYVRNICAFDLDGGHIAARSSLNVSNPAQNHRPSSVILKLPDCARSGHLMDLRLVRLAVRAAIQWTQECDKYAEYRKPDWLDRN